MTKKERDHLRYMAHREERIKAQQAYYRDYKKKGLRKPRKPRQQRSDADHERYERRKEERKAYQRQYYQEHREELRAKRRERVWREVILRQTI